MVRVYCEKVVISGRSRFSTGNFSQAADKIAIVNMGSLFQQVARKPVFLTRWKMSSKAVPAN